MILLSSSEENISTRVSLVVSFIRSQVSSIIATLLDFALVFGLTELLDFYYVASVAIGALAGAVSHFLLSRNWSFMVHDKAWHGQAFRYALVSGTSLVLNCAGVYLVTEFLGIHYGISVAVVSFFVGILFNFPMHRHYVFH